MIEYQKQLKLQSYLDGELPEAEAAEVARWLSEDQEASALLTELRQTTQAMAGFEDGVRLPESREFFWSKIALLQIATSFVRRALVGPVETGYVGQAPSTERD